MSFGSRANQAKPEAPSSSSEQLPETASFFAGDRRFVSACVRRFPFGNLYLHAWVGPRTGAQYGAESRLRGCMARDHASHYVRHSRRRGHKAAATQTEIGQDPVSLGIPWRAGKTWRLTTNSNTTSTPSSKWAK